VSAKMDPELEKALKAVQDAVKKMQEDLEKARKALEDEYRKYQQPATTRR